PCYFVLNDTATSEIYTLSLHDALPILRHYEAKWNSCEIRYGDLKKQLAEDIISVTSPIRERIVEIEKDDSYLHRVTLEGAEMARSEEHTSELQSRENLVCRLLLEKKNK